MGEGFGKKGKGLIRKGEGNGGIKREVVDKEVGMEEGEIRGRA